MSQLSPMLASTNFADVSRFLVGSDDLCVAPFFIKTFNIPGIQMQHLTMGNRSGTKLHLGADTMEFDPLELEIMLDANFEVYFEFLRLAQTSVDFDRGTFAQPEFSLWVAIMNTSNEVLFRFDFVGCRINSLGSLAMDPEAEPGTSINVSIVYDYYRWQRTPLRTELCEPKAGTLDSFGLEIKPLVDAPTPSQQFSSAEVDEQRRLDELCKEINDPLGSKDSSDPTNTNSTTDEKMFKPINKSIFKSYKVPPGTTKESGPKRFYGPKDMKSS